MIHLKIVFCSLGIISLICYLVNGGIIKWDLKLKMEK
jgi:hypothetical protein